MKAAKDGEDSTNAMLAVRMAATKNNDMPSTMHVNTSANESPRDEQFSKRDDVCKYFVHEKKFNYSTELSFTTAFR